MGLLRGWGEIMKKKGKRKGEMRRKRGNLFFIWWYWIIWENKEKYDIFYPKRK